MEIKKSTWIVMLLTILLVLSSCGKEQPPVMEEAEEPCDCATEVSAEFLMEELTTPIPSLTKYTETDTIFKGKNVRFTALEENAEYTWYLGAEVVTDQQITRYFDDVLAGTNHTISLAVQKTPNTNCLPNDDGYDSISKTLHVSNLPIYNSPDAILGPVEGDFRVKSAHLPDSFDIHIDVTYQVGDVYFNIENYDGLGSNCIQQARPTGSNYRQMFGFYGVSTMQCDAMQGDVHIRMDGIVEMDFTFFNPNDPNYVERQYLGRKL
ncbi:hypothetical protein [Parvicella tangerina]|nr:hypothetical protein [Parvicella tangerina]